MSRAIKHLLCAQPGGSHRQMTSHVILPVGTLTPNHGQGNRVWGWGLSRCPGTQGPWDLPGSCCIWEAHPIRPRLQDPWEAAWVLVGTPAREPTARAGEVVLGRSALLAGMRGWGQCGSFQVPVEGGQSYHSAWAGPAGFSCPVLTRPPVRPGSVATTRVPGLGCASQASAHRLLHWCAAPSSLPPSSSTSSGRPP